MAATGGGSRTGVHRSIDPVGVLPQTAWRLDNRPELWSTEVRLDVELLVLHPAAFRRLNESCGGEPRLLRAAVLETIAERGKLQEPASGAGGTLVGTLGERGADHPLDMRRGWRVAAPAALSVTPLWLRDISSWDGRGPVVPVRGHAILFANTPVARLPDDLPLTVALAALQVAAVPASVRRHLVRGSRVAVLDAAGTAGTLAAVAAREGGAKRVAATVGGLHDARRLEQVGAAVPVVVDATDALTTAAAVEQTLGAPADLTVVCSASPGAEASALLTTRPGGTVLLLPSATSLPELTLQAETLGLDLDLVLVCGLPPGADEHAFDLVRTYPSLRALFDEAAGIHLAASPGAPR